MAAGEGLAKGAGVKPAGSGVVARVTVPFLGRVTVEHFEEHPTLPMTLVRVRPVDGE